MLNRSIINIILFVLFIIAVIVGGIFMLKELQENKQVLQTDLYASLPRSVSSFVQINKPEYMNRIIDTEDVLNEVVQNMSSKFSYPLLIVENENDSYLMFKINSRQESEMREILEKRLYPHYPARERIYKDVKLLFYPSGDNLFFVCMFYKSMFVGGYNFELLEKIIDVDLGQSAGIASTPLGRETIRKIESYYPANLFLNNKSGFSVFNIDFDEKEYQMEGYDTEVINNEWLCENKTEYNLDYSIFPDITDSYLVDYYNPYVRDSFQCYFDKPLYSFSIPEQSDTVYALRNSGDKFIIYNLLNDLEEKFTGKRFKINDFYEDYRIYTTSGQLARQVFGFTTPAYIVFYKDYFVFSGNKDSLKAYIKNKGKYKSEFSIDEKDEEIISVFYTADPDWWHPDFFPPNRMSRSIKGGAYIVSFKEGNTRKSKIFIDN